MKYIYHDGGAEGMGSRADCTVRTTAIVAGMGYVDADALLARLGRRRGRRFKFAEVAKHLGMVTVPGMDKKTVRAALNCLPKRGRFAVKVRGHVFSVIDRAVFDTFKPKMGSRVICVWGWKKAKGKA